jgi:hypothetical protein
MRIPRNKSRTIERVMSPLLERRVLAERLQLAGALERRQIFYIGDAPHLENVESEKDLHP